MRWAGVLVRCGAAAALLSVPRAAVAQTTPDLAAQRAESLRLSGRPWHAAETLLAAAAREPRLNATFIVEGAKAELHARRYDRAYHCRRRTCARTRWYSARDNGVNRKRPNPV